MKSCYQKIFLVFGLIFFVSGMQLAAFTPSMKMRIKLMLDDLNQDISKSSAEVVRLYSRDRARNSLNEIQEKENKEMEDDKKKVGKIYREKIIILQKFQKKLENSEELTEEKYKVLMDEFQKQIRKNTKKLNKTQAKRFDRMKFITTCRKARGEIKPLLDIDL